MRTEFHTAAKIQADVMDVKNMPHLKDQDVSDAVMYLLSLPPNVNVRNMNAQKMKGSV